MSVGMGCVCRHYRMSGLHTRMGMGGRCGSCIAHKYVLQYVCGVSRGYGGLVVNVFYALWSWGLDEVGWSLVCHCRPPLRRRQRLHLCTIRAPTFHHVFPLTPHYQRVFRTRTERCSHLLLTQSTYTRTHLRSHVRLGLHCAQACIAVRVRCL